MAGSVPGIRRLIAVASGKGGVGKSTVAVNVAAALAQEGARVGLLDADVLGPSVPTLLGAPRGVQLVQGPDGILPIVRFGVRFVSMGLLTDHDKPAVLRGPMVLKYLHVFLQQVAWGELDWLVMDLPPGTGDVQLTLAQGVPLDGAVIVTTPQDVSLDIARRGLRMFETVKVPLLGIVENMSGFTCPHCGEVTPVFKQGGGSTLAADTSVPLLGSIPLDPEVMAGGDAGTPIVVAKPASPTAVAFRDIARAVAGRVGDVATAALGAFNWKWDREGPGWNEAATKRDGRPGVPVGLSRANPRTLGILWEDGARTEHDVRELRLACECAQCREEMTGRVTLDPSRVPLDVAPRSISSVGSYAIAVAWSDGHNSGIYAFERLRALGDARAPAHEV